MSVTVHTHCANPLCGRKFRPGEKSRFDWCGTCYRRWDARGRPPVGPGPPGKQGGDREPFRVARRARVAEAVRLACAGVSRKDACARMGVAISTYRQYLAEYESSGGTITVDLSAAAEQVDPPAAGTSQAPGQVTRVTHYNGRDLEDWEADIITQAREEARQRDNAMLPAKKKVA